MDSLYIELIKATDMTPETDEGEQTFLTRLAKGVSNLPEAAFDALSDEAQDWNNDAIVAIKHDNPIAALTGAPFEPVADKEADEPPLPLAGGRGNKGGKGSKATATEKASEPAQDAKTTKGGKGAKSADKASTPTAEAPPAAKSTKRTAKGAAPSPAAVAAAEKKAAAAKAEREKEAAERVAANKSTKADRKALSRNKVTSAPDDGGGALDKLLEAVFENPKATPKQLIEMVEAKYKGDEVKMANAVGIRQQFRRVVRLLERHGALAAPGIKLD